MATQSIKPHRKFEGHTGWIRSVIHLTGRQRMMTCSLDGSLRSWNLETGEQIGNDWRDEENRLYAAALSPDGKKIVSGGEGCVVKLWDIDTAKAIAKWTGHGGGITSVCWNRDGGRILSGSYDRTAMVWDAESGNTILAIKTGHGAVYSAIYSPDETMIASSGESGENGFIKIWDANTGALIAKLEGHTDAVTCLVWTAQSTLISGSEDHSIRTWNTTTWEQIKVLSGHTDAVFAIKISDNGRILASASRDKTVRLWGLENGQPIGSPLQHADISSCVSFSTNATILTTGCNDGNAYSWDIDPIVREAGRDELFDSKKSFLDSEVDPTRRREQDNARLTQGFFDNSPRHPRPPGSRETTVSTSQHHAPRRTLLGRISLLFRRAHHTTNDTKPQPSLLERARNHFSDAPHRRNDEGIEFQEHHQIVVDVPLAKGHFRNHSARELLMKRKKEKAKATAVKNASGGAAQAQPSSNLHATVSGASSTTPAIVSTSAATTSTTSPPDVMIPRAGRWTRFRLFICCVSTQTIDGHH